MDKLLKKPKLGGAIYVIPNLLTTGNLFFGFYSIVNSLNLKFEVAAICLMLAAVFDVLDGRVARLTKGTSEFGVQYDSLCDLASFGLAPTFLAYQFGLSQLGKLGWIICFLFLACGALRLARFNVQSSIGKASKDFTGLPIPMAALWVGCFVIAVSDLKGVVSFEVAWLTPFYNILKDKTFHTAILAVTVPFLSIMMVSNVAFRSHKTLKFKAIKPFKMLVGFVFAIALVSYEPGLTGLLLSSIYAVSGPVEWLFGWKKAHDEDEIFEPSPEDEEEELTGDQT